MNLRHILLMRTDHLGDMILTLPMASAIKAALPNCRVSVLASNANAAAAAHHPHVDHVEIDPQESKGSNLTGVFELSRRLRGLACDAAVVVHPTPRLAIAAFLARIPIRVGTAYRAYSPLFNRRVRQHRRAETSKHEAELNVELLHDLHVIGKEPPRARWRIDPPEAEAIAQLLKSYDLKPKQFVAVHPGSAGSAMNWETAQYNRLVATIVRMGIRVVITGGPGEVELTRQVAAVDTGGVVDLGGKVSLPQLAALLAQASAYVGCSTGPTHIAAAVGTPVVALYPPLRATLPHRWRPLGNEVRIFQPEVGQVCVRCLEEQCPFFHCVQTLIDVDSVANATRDLARRTEIR